MSESERLEEIEKNLAALDEKYEMLQTQMFAVVSFLKEHQELHRRASEMDQEFTEEDFMNMVGAPFPNKKE